MNHYEQKQEERRERYEELAAKNRREADSAFKRERQIMDMIPMGQPILVGHHSEKRHRRDLARSDSLMRKGIEAGKTAAYYDQKAESVGTGGISSDDPDAVTKLTEKLAGMEAQRDRMKLVNAAHARFLRKPETLDTADLTDAEKITIRTYKPAYSWEKHPFPPYSFQNLGGNIARVKARIAQLTAQVGRESSEKEYGDARIVENADENRVQVFFPGKPADDVRERLKARGFRWSPMAGAWQRHLNNSGIYCAEEFGKWYADRTASRAATLAAIEKGDL